MTLTVNFIAIFVAGIAVAFGQMCFDVPRDRPHFLTRRWYSQYHDQHGGEFRHFETTNCLISSYSLISKNKNHEARSNDYYFQSSDPNFHMYNGMKNVFAKPNFGKDNYVFSRTVVLTDNKVNGKPMPRPPVLPQRNHGMPLWFARGIEMFHHPGI